MNKIKFISALLLIIQSPLLAAEGEQRAPAVAYILGFSILLIVFVLWLAIVYSEKNDTKGDYFLLPLISLKNKLTNMAPLDKEKEVLMDHDYDGIKELNNPIPPWFNFLFYGSILFAVVYLFYFHIAVDWSSAGEYQAEMKAAQLQKEILIRSGALVNEETVTELSDVASLSGGKEIYAKNCASCHGKLGEGLVGPNLTDEYWIHGGGIKNVFKTIKYGVPQKGMISWEKQLGPKKIQEVASFILSLEGSNPPNAKEPQGEKYMGNNADKNSGA